MFLVDGKNYFISCIGILTFTVENANGYDCSDHDTYSSLSDCNTYCNSACVSHYDSDSHYNTNGYCYSCDNFPGWAVAIIVIGIILTILVPLLLCLFCPLCWLAKYRRRRSMAFRTGYVVTNQQAYVVPNAPPYGQPNAPIYSNLPPPQGHVNYNYSPQYPTPAGMPPPGWTQPPTGGPTPAWAQPPAGGPPVYTATPTNFGNVDTMPK